MLYRDVFGFNVEADTDAGIRALTGGADPTETKSALVGDFDNFFVTPFEPVGK